VGLGHLVMLCLVDTCRRQYYVLGTLLSASESDPRRKGNSSSLAGRIRNDRRTVMRRLIVLLGACSILAAGAAFAVVRTITPAFALTAVQSAAHDTALARSTMLTVPFPTDANSGLNGHLPTGLSAGAGFVQVYSQTGPGPR
jgi:hypothetical protein